MRTILFSALFAIAFILGNSYPIAAHSADEEEVEAFEEIDEPILTPDNPFYFFKQWGEAVETFLAQGDAAQAELETKFAERRVGEIKKIAREKREDLLEKLSERWQKHLESAREKTEKLVEKKEEVREKVLESTSKHLSVLERVYENAPEQAKEGLQRAIDNAKRHQQKMVDQFTTDKHQRLKDHLKKRFEKFREKFNLNQERFKELHPNSEPKE